MHLLISIPAALLGSMLGSAVRGGVAVAQQRVEGAGDKGASQAANVINVSGSPVAALAGGLAGSVLGWGTAFWVGAVLGAAGMDRLDARLLGMVGIDMDAMMAKAMHAAAKARDAAASGGEATSASTEPA
jgi:hypothetical protein